MYDHLARGGTPVDSTYPSKMIELPDGTRVGIREVSKSGGSTVDVSSQTAPTSSAPAMTLASAVARELLQAGVDDWVPLIAVEGIARRHGGGTDEEIRGASIAAIKDLVVRGLVEIGEVSDGGFFAWDEPLEGALQRIRETWETTPPNTWGFAVWLSNTPEGDEEVGRSPANGTEH